MATSPTVRYGRHLSDFQAKLINNNDVFFPVISPGIRGTLPRDLVCNPPPPQRRLTPYWIQNAIAANHVPGDKLPY